MSNHFICVGGTGSRVGEAFVYLAATGYIGLGDTRIWIVDKDTKCANGNTLRSACNEYINFQNRCLLENTRWPWFNHNLSLSEWNFDKALKDLNPQSDGSSAFKELGNLNAETGMMMKFLHDAESLDNSMSKGFYGRAQTGTALYKSIEQIPSFFDQDALFKEIDKDIKSGNRPCIYLAGSSFGATGASLLPNMAKTLRTKFAENVAIGGVLMLPYFTYSDKTKDGGKPLVSPDTHWNKAREALRYYGDSSRMSIRKINEPMFDPNNTATFDAFYVAGSVPLTNINQEYSEGGEGQDNNCHIAELYAAIGAKHFFDMCKHNTTDSAFSGFPAVYAYYLDQAGVDLNWQRIDPMLKRPMLALARFAVAVLTYLHPLTHQKQKLNTDQTMIDCFGKESFMSKTARIDEATIKESVNCAAAFSKRFLDYVHQINGVGPDVNLFDLSFLEKVLMALNEFSDAPAFRFRDLALCDAYDFSSFKKIYQLCQLHMVRENLSANVAVTARQTNIGQIINQITKDMNSVRSASVAPSAYPAHSEYGMRKIYDSVYSFCI